MTDSNPKSRTLGLADRNQDKAEELYKKRLARLREMDREALYGSKEQRSKNKDKSQCGVEKAVVSADSNADLLPSEDQGRGASVLISVPLAQCKLSQSSAEGLGKETLDGASEVERSRIAQRVNSLDSFVLSHQGERTRPSANEDRKPCGQDNNNTKSLDPSCRQDDNVKGGRKGVRCYAKENDIVKSLDPSTSLHSAHDDGVKGGEVRVNGLSIPAQTNTSFVPYVTSVTKQCVQPIAYGIKLIATFHHLITYITTITLTIIVSGLFTQALAQPRQDTGAVAGVELRVGDLVPDQFWQTPYRIWKDGNMETAALAQFKDRPVILAFWMIHCGACTLNLIRMNEWAGKFGDRVAFVPINAAPRDSEQEIDALLSGSTGRLPAPLTLPSVTDGERAKRFFPHVAVPHYVWIDRKQRVRAITQGYFVNQTQIETWLEHQEK